MPTPNLTIDLVHLLLCASTFVSALCVVTLLRQGDRRRDLLGLSWGAMLISFAFLLIVLRGQIPDIVSIPVANCLIVLGFGLCSIGARQLNSEPATADRVMLGVGMVLFIAVYLAGGDAEARTVAISVPMLWYSLQLARSFWLAREVDRHRHARIAAYVFGGVAATVALRLLVALGATPSPGRDVLHVLPLSMGVALLFLVVGTVALDVLELARRPAAPGHNAPVPAVPVARGGGSSAWRLLPGRALLLTPDGSEVRLTGNELLVAQALAEAGEAPSPRSRLNEMIGRGDNPKDRAIDILISRLRRKCLEAGAELPVTSVRGRGYMFNAALERGDTLPAQK